MTTEEKEVCPLCMEPMEADDLAFYPCDCRYQVCRFCWAKIINEENGLCPACRKEYNSEKPALYKPVSEAEDAKVKATRKRKENLKKTKLNAEMLKILPELRVVQPNLIFVVGLPAWICKDKEVLKGSDYFGRYGKVFKVEINQNQTFGGPQGQPTFSAYITFCRAEDAMRSIRELDQGMLHGRPLRVSLGTTKYCSQFLRGTKCTKHECMYLHELGDPAASFTKEEMQAGKHTEYMNKLLKDHSSSAHQPSVSSVPSQSTVSDATGTPSASISTDIVTPPATEASQPINCGRGRVRSGGTATERPTDSPPQTKSAGYNGVQCKLANGPGPSCGSSFGDSRRPRQCRTDRLYSDFSPAEGNVVWNRRVSASEYPSRDDTHKNTSSGKHFSHSYGHAYTNGLDGSDREKLSSTRSQHKSSADGRRTSTYYNRSDGRQPPCVSGRKHLTEHLHPSNTNSNCAAPTAPLANWNHRTYPIGSDANRPLSNMGDDAVDIDFDPFRESQQGLAELLAAEVSKLVVDEVSSHSSTFGVNRHPSAQGRDISGSDSLPRHYLIEDGGNSPHENKQRPPPWLNNVAPSETQELPTAVYKHAATLFNSCVFPPPGFESNSRGGVHQSADSSSPLFSPASLLDFGLTDSSRSPGAPFNMNDTNNSLSCANGTLTDEPSSPFPYPASLSNPTSRPDAIQYDTQSKMNYQNDSSANVPLLNGPGAIFRPYPTCMDDNLFRPADSMRPDPQQVLSQLLATTFNAASGILNNNSGVSPSADKSTSTTASASKSAGPPFDLSAFVNYLCRLSPLFASLNPQLSNDWVNGSGTSRSSTANSNFPEPPVLDSSASVLSAAASILFPALQAAAQFQSKSNEFLSSTTATTGEPVPPPPLLWSRHHDGSRLSSQAFPPGLVRQTPFLNQSAFPPVASEKGLFGAVSHGGGLKASSELAASDSSLTWQLDDPAIVSSQLNASASASQNEADATWKPDAVCFSPVDVLQQLWRSGSSLPVFDGQDTSFSNYPAQPSNSSNGSTSTSQMQTIRESSLHPAPQTD